MMASLKLVLLFCCVSKCETDQSSRSNRPSKPFLTASILMQCNPSLDLCNPTPSWWLGWVGWGWQARQFGFTTLYILQPQTMASCRCCRVFLLYIWGERAHFIRIPQKIKMMFVSKWWCLWPCAWQGGPTCEDACLTRQLFLKYGGLRDFVPDKPSFCIIYILQRRVQKS